MGEGRIVPCGLGREGCQCVWVGLVVWRLGLDQGHEHVLGVRNLVVVQLVVFRGRAIQPDGSIALYQDTTTVVDVDLVVVRQIELVVRRPEPSVLDVGACLLCKMQQHERADALRVGGCGHLGRLGALVALQFRARGAANAEVHIPHTHRSLAGFGNIPFHQDCPRCRALGLDGEVGDLHRALFAGLTNLK